MSNQEPPQIERILIVIFLASIILLVAAALREGGVKLQETVMVTGILTFFAVIVIALSGHRFRLGELEEGEVRKAIAIAFTTIYLIMLPYYFFYAYMPAAQNATFVRDASNASPIQTFNATATTVPLLAITDFTTNFLYIYIIIVLFYFGTRAFEDYLRFKDPKSNALKQFASGKINDEKLKMIVGTLEIGPLAPTPLTTAEECNAVGIRLAAGGKHEEAVKFFDAANNLDPNYIEAWFNKSKSYSALGRKGDLKKALERAEEILEKTSKEKREGANA